ncbi:MAG TPA: hypothetical protein VMW83_13585 [Spirochaetia bacterium]|nr:hypothetical protein [Spirochaetia bacterium]
MRFHLFFQAEPFHGPGPGLKMVNGVCRLMPQVGEMISTPQYHPGDPLRAALVEKLGADLALRGDALQPDLGMSTRDIREGCQAEVRARQENTSALRLNQDRIRKRYRITYNCAPMKTVIVPRLGWWLNITRGVRSPYHYI